MSAERTEAVPHAPARPNSLTLTLRMFIFACAVGGVITTLAGLRLALSSGAPARFTPRTYQVWGVLPYVILFGISLLRVSRRSLATLLVATLLAWFMSTGYGNLDQMDLGVGIIPLVQVAFIGGALTVMFTFWLLRPDKR